MSRSKGKASAALLDQLLAEASWLLSHAQALSDYGRREEAAAEWARAGVCEEQAACLLEADGREGEAAIHRVSAAACSEKVGQHVRAVTLLRAALSVPLPDEYRAGAEQQLAQALAESPKEVSREFAPRAARRQAPVVP